MADSNLTILDSEKEGKRETFLNWHQHSSTLAWPLLILYLIPTSLPQCNLTKLVFELAGINAIYIIMNGT